MIHVYDGELLDQQMIFEFMKAVTEIAEKSSDSLVYGVLNFVSSLVKKFGKHVVIVKSFILFFSEPRECQVLL